MQPRGVMGEFTTLVGDRIIKPNEEGKILWHVANYTTDMDRFKFLLIVEQAFAIWQPHFFPIRFESTKDFDKAHIKIFVAEGDHEETIVKLNDGRNFRIGCKHKFDGKDGVLAHAFAPHNGHLNGHCHLDEAENWADAHKPHTKDLLTVLVHEFGHNFNVGHSKHPDAVMFAEYNGEKRVLHSDDIAAINHLYGEEKRYWAEVLGLDPNIPTSEEEEPEIPVMPEQPEEDMERSFQGTAKEWFIALGITAGTLILIYLGGGF